ncbi:MAG TPA: hypothetical protein VMQ73_00055 [Methylomirabilota bacterium]|nr:hypothetical protein [Methylomirabilota bacterium]
MRPQDLREVAAVTIAGTKPFGNAIDEFIDAFYLDHPDKARQQRRLDEPPAIVGDPFIDAWIGAVGEHLAQRWTLAVPAWTRRPEHNRLSRPTFVPDSMALRGTLITESPPAFRSRMIFTFIEPLQRARFPRDVPRIRRPS